MRNELAGTPVQRPADANTPSANSPRAGGPWLGFPKSSRLVTKADFDRAYQRRCKAGDGVLLVFAVPNGTGSSRLGLSVSRKVGPAVVRNRIKRLLREAFRLQQHELPRGLDLVVIPTAPDQAVLPVYRKSLRKLLTKLARRLAETESQTAAEAAAKTNQASTPESPS